MTKAKTSTTGEHTPGADGLLFAHSIQKFQGSPLQTDRNLGAEVTLVTASDILDDLDAVVLVDATAGAVTLQLPAYQPYMTRMHYRILRIDSASNAVLVTPRTGFSDVLNGLTEPSGLYIGRQYAGLDVWCGNDSSGAFDGSGHGLWYGYPTGVLSVPDSRRLTTPLTALTTTEVDLTTGTSWGTSPSKTLDSGSNDLLGQVNVTADASPGANPSVRITFKDGAFPSAPLVLLTPIGVNTVFLRHLSTTTTTMTFQLIGTPTSGTTYRAVWQVIGR